MDKYVACKDNVGDYGVLNLETGNFIPFPDKAPNDCGIVDHLNSGERSEAIYHGGQCEEYGIDLESERKKHGWVTREENVSEIKLYEGCWVETEDSQIYGPVHNAKSTAAPAFVEGEYIYWAKSTDGGWQNWNAYGETRHSRDPYCVKTVYPSDPRKLSPPTVSVVSRIYKELTTDHIRALTHDVSTGIWLVQNRKTGDQITVNVEFFGELLAVLGKMKEAGDE